MIFPLQEKVNNFVKVPNIIVMYSCLFDNRILPIYLYSQVNKNWSSGTVNTTLKNIIDTYESNSVNRKYKQDKEYLATFLSMFDDLKDGKNIIASPFGELTCIGDNSKKKNFSISTPITYKVYDDWKNVTNGFIKIEIDEYEYLVDFLTQEKNKSKINSLVLINLYALLRVNVNKLENKIFEDITSYGLAKVLKTSDKTITRYIVMLKKIGMIDENFGEKTYDGKTKWFSNMWRKRKNNDKLNNFHEVLMEKLREMENKNE